MLRHLRLDFRSCHPDHWDLLYFRAVLRDQSLALAVDRFAVVDLLVADVVLAVALVLVAALAFAF